MRYPVLQSGYVGLTDINLVQPVYVEQTFKQMVLAKDVKNPLNNYFFSKEVTDLFECWSADFKILKTFDFREKILQAATTLFGKRSLREFLELQSLHASFSDLHKEFLADTISYVIYGCERKVECLMWSRLLFPGNGNSVRLHVDDFKNDTFKEIPKRKFENMDTIPFITAWVSQQDGYADLLKTLFVVFGQRQSQLHIA